MLKVDVFRIELDENVSALYETLRNIVFQHVAIAFFLHYFDFDWIPHLEHRETSTIFVFRGLGWSAIYRSSVGSRVCPGRDNFIRY